MFLPNQSQQVLLGSDKIPRYCGLEICRTFAADRWSITITVPTQLWKIAAQELQADSPMMKEVLAADSVYLDMPGDPPKRSEAWQSPTQGYHSRWGFGGCAIVTNTGSGSGVYECRIPIISYDLGSTPHKSYGPTLHYVNHAWLTVGVIFEALNRARQQQAGKTIFIAPRTTPEEPLSQGLVIDTFTSHSPFTVAIDEECLREINLPSRFHDEGEPPASYRANQWLKIIWKYFGQEEPAPILKLINGHPRIYLGNEILFSRKKHESCDNQGGFYDWRKISDDWGEEICTIQLTMTILVGIIQLVGNSHADRRSALIQRLLSGQSKP